MAKGPRTVLTLADGIAAHWDLPRDSPEPLGGGYHNDVLRLGNVVIRIERRKPESVAWEHELTRGDAGTDWVRYLLAELRELA